MKVSRVTLGTTHAVSGWNLNDDRAQGGDHGEKTRGRVKAKQSRPAAKGDLVRRSKASAYAKRTARGRFNEMDDVGRSQKVDKRRKAKKCASSGYGDQGDRRLRSRA